LIPNVVIILIPITLSGTAEPNSLRAAVRARHADAARAIAMIALPTE
jgi:hypothetical protein